MTQSVSTRRALFRSTALLTAGVALFGCTTPSSSIQLTPAEVITDVNTFVQTAENTISAVQVVKPGLLDPTKVATVEAQVATVQATIATLTPSLPAVTSAANLKTVEGYFNDVLSLLATVAPAAAAVPALIPLAAGIETLNALAPLIEAFINQYAPTTVSERQVGKVPELGFGYS